MNDTPNFEQYRSRFNSFVLPELIDNVNAPVPEPDRTIIKTAYERLSAYFTEETYRHSLTITRKNNIEAQINAILDQFQALQNSVTTIPNQLSQNLPNITNNIQANLEEIDLRFWQPYETYILRGNDTELAGNVAQIKKSAREAEDAKNKATEALRAAGLIVSGGAEIEVANHFQRSVNGLTIEENDQLLDDKKPVDSNKVLWILIAISVAAIIGAILFAKLIDKFDGKSLEHYFYSVGAIGLLTAYPIATFIRGINKSQPSGYLRSATFWIIGAVLSVAGTGVYSAILLHGFDGGSDLTQIIPSIVSLLAPAYLVRFCVQNYKANKHMATVNQQKVVIARSIIAFTQNLQEADEALKVASFNAKSEIQKNVAVKLFEPAESGYITTKEGAGSGDTIFQGTPFDSQPK